MSGKELCEASEYVQLGTGCKEGKEKFRGRLDDQRSFSFAASRELLYLRRTTIPATGASGAEFSVLCVLR